LSANQSRDDAFNQSALSCQYFPGSFILAWVERVVLNALANGTAALPPDILALSAIHVPSVQVGLAFSGEADPP
jgi:hypothetical protein